MEVCRLCILHQDHHINIFSSGESYKNVLDVINEHIGKVNESDPLPKYICIGCWKKVADFHEFHQKVSQAQTIYLSKLVKEEQDNNFVEDQTELEIPDYDFLCAEDIDHLDSLELVKQEQYVNGDTQIAEKNLQFKRATSMEPINEYSDLESLTEGICSDDFLKNDSDIVGNGKNKKKTSVARSAPTKRITRSCADYENAEKSKLLPLCIETQRHQLKYTCDICKKKIATKHKLKIHLMRHLSYSCQICSKSYLNPKKLELHIKTEHREVETVTKLMKQLKEFEKPLKKKDIETFSLQDCDICKEDLNTTSIQRIREHYKEKHNIEYDRMKCCNLKFAAENHDQSHSKHSLKRPTLADFFTMKCNLCENESFESLSNAQKHYMIEHGINGYLICCNSKFMEDKSIQDHFQYHLDQSNLKCTYCDKYFDRRNALSAHLSKHRAVESKKFVCHVCEKAFFCNYDLKKHAIVHDKTKKKVHPCPQCNKRYSSIRSMEAHIKFIHNKNGKSEGVICEYCGKEFFSRSSVVSHVQTVHRMLATNNGSKVLMERSECNLCKKTFVNKYRLKKHIDSIHMGTPQKCSMCDKVAPNAAALTCHMRSVHVESIYKCKLCDKSFKAAVALKDHIATHTGEKMYKCSFCPEAFIWRPNMYAHQKRAHPEEWRKSRKKSIISKEE